MCALDANKLHNKIYEKGLTIDRVSKMSGINIELLGEVIFGHKPITIGNAAKLKETLGLTNAEAINIFLS